MLVCCASGVYHAVMATGDIDLGPSGRRFATRVRETREGKRLNLSEVADRLTDIGRPIMTSGISKLERGVRRVDVDDLLALAIVLETPPNMLMLPPPTSPDEMVELAPGKVVPLAFAWRWANMFVPMSDRAVLQGALTADDAVKYADKMRPIGDAIRTALGDGVPADKVYAWIESFLTLFVTGSIGGDHGER